MINDTNDLYDPDAGHPPLPDPERLDAGGTGRPGEPWPPPGPATMIRRPPPGLSRRDRRTWRQLELARLERDTAAATSSREHQTGWQPGFIRSPPRGLGRRGRKAWLAAERAHTARWWHHRRGSAQDAEVRAIGVLTIALLMSGGLLWAVLATLPLAPPAPAVSPQAPLTPLIIVNVPTPPRVITVTTGDTSTATQPPARALNGTGPAAAPPVAGGWQPTPPGGVTALPPVPATPIKPASVTVRAVPTGPPTTAELSTPTGALTAWLARTCPSTWSDPFGTDLRRGKSLMTTAGWATADPTKDAVGQRLWPAVNDQRQTRRCGNLTAQLSPDAPIDHGVAFVEYSVDRVVTSTTSAAVVEHLVGARLLVRQPGGRWLVDHAVAGG